MSIFNDSNSFRNVGIKNSNNELIVMNISTSSNNLSFHSSTSGNNVDIMNIKTILNKDQNKELHLSAFDGSTINPIIKINNTHQHVDIMSNLNVASNLNVDILNIKTLLNKDQNKELHLSAFDGSTINPIIKINNTHQHVNIMSNLNVASNLNVDNLLTVTTSNTTISNDLKLKDKTLLLYQSRFLKTENNTEFYGGTEEHGHASWSIKPRVKEFKLDFLISSSETTGNSPVGVCHIDGAGDFFNYSFTGQHRNKTINNDIYNNIEDYIGYICYSIGKFSTYDFNKKKCHTNYEAITINDSIPIIDITTMRQDKRVFGVISDKEEEERILRNGVFISQLSNENDDKRVYVNSIGEGAIWIVNTSGNLENGDYIQSSLVAGHGEKQDSEFLANYTVAKITCDCDFTLNSKDYNCIEFIDNTSGNTYRKAFVGCTYHCG